MQQIKSSSLLEHYYNICNMSLLCLCLCVQVQYVDYGLVENIPVVHVYPVLLCDDVPQLCMPCQLHRINPVRAPVWADFSLHVRLKTS